MGFNMAPLSPEAQRRFAETNQCFQEARKRRAGAASAWVAKKPVPKPVTHGITKEGVRGDITPAPTAAAAASIKKQNEAMGIQDPAKPGFGAQVVPVNQPPIQGAGQAPKRAGGQINPGVVGGRVNVAPKRGTTAAPLSKAYLEGRKETQKFFEDAGNIRKAQMEKRK